MKKKQVKRELVLAYNDVAKILFGEFNTTLKDLERDYGVRIGSRGNRIFILGDSGAVKKAEKAITNMYLSWEKYKMGEEKHLTEKFQEIPSGEYFLGFTRNGHRIIPRSPNQVKYVKAMFEKDIVFSIGPAGTGKTYLAVVMAVHFLRQRMVEKIILTRPVVEAGEKLGYLPGDIQEKVNPYLRPIYDSLNDIMDRDEFFRLLERNVIEIAPLAFMRGRTLNNAFIILDEAQNTTIEQMKMFLTRIGFNTKSVITGDITQIDLSERGKSGLIHALRILRNISEIEFIELTDEDVVRHPVVQKIIKAYEENNS